MRRVFVLYSQPIRFARFCQILPVRESRNSGVGPAQPSRDSALKERGLWGREWCEPTVTNFQIWQIKYKSIVGYLSCGDERQKERPDHIWIS